MSNLKTLFQQSMLNKLLMINIGIYLLIAVSNILFYLCGMGQANVGYADYIVLKYLAVPAYLPSLAVKFFTPITYMFLHTEFWHILGNMLWLYFMGQLFATFLNNKQLFGVYFLGGLSGALMYVLAYNIFPVFAGVLPGATCIGASAAVSAIVIAIAVMQPNYEVRFFGIIPVSLKWLGIIYVVYDVFQLVGENAGGHFAHLGGALFGFIFATMLKKGKDITSGFNKMVDWIVSVWPTGGKRSNMRVAYRNTKEQTRSSYMSDGDFNQNKASDQQRMDEILEKISKSGYNNLSKEEKEFLFRMSRK